MMNIMLPTLFLNLMIVLAVCFVVYLEHNSLALLALTLMLPLPIGAASPRFLETPHGGDEDDSKPIGFTANIS